MFVNNQIVAKHVYIFTYYKTKLFINIYRIDYRPENGVNKIYYYQYLPLIFEIV